jgi:enoyl-[acyl-carrier protein] reductase II
MVGGKSGPLRVVRNACSTEMAEFEKTTDDVTELRAKIGYHRFPQAALQGDVENGLVVAGQVAGMVTDLPSVKELIPRIVAEAAETLARQRDAASAA